MMAYIIALVLNCFIRYNLGKKHGFEDGYKYHDEEVETSMKNPN